MLMINLVLAITSPYMERFFNTDIFVHLNEAVYRLQDLSPKLNGEGHIDLSTVKKNVDDKPCPGHYFSVLGRIFKYFSIVCLDATIC